jgi:hypothetical protein
VYVRAGGAEPFRLLDLFSELQPGIETGVGNPGGSLISGMEATGAFRTGLGSLVKTVFTIEGLTHTAWAVLVKQTGGKHC